jgi:hypothetical protein
VVLAIGHALRTHEALGCPDALPCFLEIVHRLFEDGVFVGHDKSMRAGILRSLDWFTFPRENSYMFRDAMLKLLLAETLPYENSSRNDLRAEIIRRCLPVDWC